MGEHSGSFSFVSLSKQSLFILIITSIILLLVPWSGVTAEDSTSLRNFLTNPNTDVQVNAPVVDGHYQVVSGEEYKISLKFHEDGATYAFDNGHTMTYQIPDGIRIIEPMTGEITTHITERGITYDVVGDYTLSPDGTFSIRFRQDDPNYHKLESATNASFRYEFQAEFEDDCTQIQFSDYITKEFVVAPPPPGKAFPSKTASYDENTGRFTYTVTVTADGNCNNVRVTDTITGNALKNISTPIISGYGGSVTKISETNGFDYIFPSMNKGDVVTITYTADADFSQDNDNDGVLDAAQTGNTVTVVPDNRPEDTTSASYDHRTPFKVIDKLPGSDSGQTVPNGEYADKIINWTIEYNKPALVSAAGDKITDTIDSTAADFMTYYGNEITVKVYDQSGSLVETRPVPYNSLTSHDATSWSYTIPSSDTNAYSYVITYQTRVDMEQVNNGAKKVTLENEVKSDHANSDKDGIVVGPDTEVSVSKSVLESSTDEVTWISTIIVPKAGLPRAVVTDYLPVRTDIPDIDLYKDGSLEITGLEPGESYTVDSVSDPTKVEITFFKDPGKTQPGLKPKEPGGHTITVKLTTKVNQNWLQAGYQTDWLQLHTNTLKVNDLYSDNASVVFGKPGITKVDPPEKSKTNGHEYLLYTLVLSGVNTDSITISDIFDTALLEVAPDKDPWDPHMKIWGGDQYSRGYGGLPVTYSDTPEGISITANDIPHDSDGNFYPYYKIQY